jgi:hypothetical protein
MNWMPAWSTSASKTAACSLACCCALQVDSNNTDQSTQIVQLPMPILELVLQRLDKCSLASSALTYACSKFSHAAPASITKVAVRCSRQQTLDSFKLWLQQHSSSINQCSIEDPTSSELSVQHSEPHVHIDHLQCPQLRKLSLRYLKLQFEPAADGRGVLHDCTCLQELDLQGCAVTDPQAAFEAIAALPELRSLSVAGAADRLCITGDLSRLTQLTRLQLDSKLLSPHQQLEQLSLLANLEDIRLEMPLCESLDGGLPSQLHKLTCLQVSYNLPMRVGGAAEQFQHLSSLTALQDLRVKGVMFFSHQIMAFMGDAVYGLLGTHTGRGISAGDVTHSAPVSSDQPGALLP